MPATPDRRFYFRLQQVAHRLRLAADRRFLEVAGVTAAQAGALYVIGGAPEVSQRALAEALGQHESAVTAMVRRLIDGGLVDRGPRPGDRRTYVLSLTAAGRRALDLLRPHVDAFTTTMTRHFGEEQLVAVTSVLTRLLELDDAGLLWAAVIDEPPLTPP